MVKFLKRLFRKLFKKNVESYNISVGYKWSGEVTGGDIIPGDVPVATSQTWNVEIYQGYFPKEGQWIVCSLTEKFWWIIPFTYDKFIFELPTVKFDCKYHEFSAREVCDFVYGYARDTRDYENISTDGCTAFIVNGKSPAYTYDTSKNEYMFRRLTGEY